MNIILPKHEFPLHEDLPYFYLIGPVLGGADWQEAMCRHIAKRTDGECIIATPTRWSERHALSSYFSGTPDAYPDQVTWEQVYIDAAITRRHSCLVAYLAGEDQKNPRRDGLPYGIDTYGEMNYFRGRFETVIPPWPLVLGVDERYPYWRTLRRNLKKSYGAEFPSCKSLSVLADRAVEFVRSQ